MISRVLRPSKSIKRIPTKVAIKLVTPRAIEAATGSYIPAKPNRRGAKYRMMLIPDNWLKAAIKKANRIG